jgi:pyruvate,water dikinase
MLFNTTLLEGKSAIIDKKLGNKVERLVYSDNQEKRVKLIPNKVEMLSKMSITNDHAIELGKWVLKLEKYYEKSVDVEFAIDGITGQLFCVQCRPETIHSNDDKNILMQYQFTQVLPKQIASGIAVGDSIDFGKVHIITSMDNRLESHEFKNGEILVSEITDPDYEPLMQKSSGIVCLKGGRTTHTAIIARELNKLTIVGVRTALETLRDGQLITIDCSKGNVGYIYDGHILFDRNEIILDKLPKSPVSIMLNVGNPAKALHASRIPYCDGVSLAREEFILASYIKIHPMNCLYPDKITDLTDKKEYNKLTAEFINYEDYFIDKMTMGIAKIAAAFYPKPVILRTMDFKQEELKSLFCGKYFETTDERNGLIGFRGC